MAERTGKSSQAFDHFAPFAYNLHYRGKTPINQTTPVQPEHMDEEI